MESIAQDQIHTINTPRPHLEFTLREFAPLLLFVYNRPKFTYELLQALKEDNLSQVTDLYIFSDAAKVENLKPQVDEVRRIIRGAKGFNKIQIVEQRTNEGLANSIINGVNEVIKKYGNVIVLEDDLMISSHFLTYMNNALKKYQNTNSIWSISGYSPPLTFPKNFNEPIYFTPRGCSWGWATWKDRWDMVDWYKTGFNQVKTSKKKRTGFNQGGNDLYKQLELQQLGKIDSWAIRWCYSQYQQGMYTVYPKYSLVQNIGFNSDATNTKGKDSRWNVSLNNSEFTLPNFIEPSHEIIPIFKKYYDLDWVGRIGYFLKKYGFYSFAQKFKPFLRS